MNGPLPLDEMINDDDEQPADQVTGGGGESEERPLGEKLPDGFEVQHLDGVTLRLTGAIELHRLAVDYNQLKKRKNEITSTIIDSKCSVDESSTSSTDYYNHYKEVSQPPILLLLRRSRHYSSLVISEMIKQRFCS